MERQIILIRRKMIFVVLILATLGAWQHAFIMEGILAHTQINLTIIGTGAFGMISAFIFVAKLANEIVAFRALKEMWDDIRRAPEEDARDPDWLYARCRKPAQVFARPRLLGHAYDLVIDELARTKSIRLSVETMNTLSHRIESSINDEKSLIVYISGLLVFMGLIGTFIGLLHMVNAIGGIIGSLSKSADAAASSGAFTQLLGALESPLHGMASGFASSLFGLFCSLLVGLMGRFAGQAAGVLKSHFEAWMSGVVDLSDAERESAPATDAHVADAGLIKLVAGLLGDYGRIAGTFHAAAKSLEDIRKVQALQTDALARLHEDVSHTRALQREGLDALAAQLPMKEAIFDFAAKLEQSVERLRSARQSETAEMRDALDALARAHAHDIRALSQRQGEGALQIAAALSEASGTLERLASASSPARIEAAVEQGLAKAWSDGAKSVRIAAKGVADRVDKSLGELRLSQEAQAGAWLAAIGEQAAQAHAPTLQAVERSLGDGVERIAQSVDAALTAYASLARVAVAALEKIPSPEVPAAKSGLAASA